MPEADGRRLPDVEVADHGHRVVIRRVVLGPLDTNCFALHAFGSRHAILVDPGDEPGRFIGAVSDLDIGLVVLTHTHWDHLQDVTEVRDALGVPVAAHPDDAPVWPHEQQHLYAHGHWDAGTATEPLFAKGCGLRPPEGAVLWDGAIDRPIADGELLRVDSLAAVAVHTPGHTPGSISLLVGGHMLTGDTLFPGGPGLTGWPFSSFRTIIQSISSRLLTLPPSTTVHPGRGRDTTIATAAPHLDEWKRRGW
jgi:hydroxyacylglutathione hydrolase